jgi:hypothetical protein
LAHIVYMTQSLILFPILLMDTKHDRLMHTQAYAYIHTHTHTHTQQG